MNHKVNNVQNLHNDAIYMHDKLVVGESYGADSILNNLNEGIENLKVNWKGKDAGYRIQEVIGVYNEMVKVRNALAQLAVDSSKVAANYREIQNANGAGLENLRTLAIEIKTFLGDYLDTSDTIDINPMAESGKRSIDLANWALDTFIVDVKSRYNSIMNNWALGTGRDDAEEAFSMFISNVNKYKETLTEVSANITKALQNYTF